MTRDQFVFGYGSLADGPDTGGFVAELLGLRRVWGVAMDNRRDVPGYKCYLDETGARPQLFVCFLDLRAAAADARVNGLCLPVSDDELLTFDRRERNYERVDVSERLASGTGDARVWAYIGSPAGRRRFAAGVAAQTAVVHAEYLAAVRRAFHALGEREWAACAPSLEPGELPVVSLTRRELT